MKKYSHSILRYFVIYTLGFAIFHLISVLAGVIYNFLSEKLPNSFPDYNPLTEKAAYLSLEATLALICAAVTVLILTVLAVRYDDERYEFIISKTDGFYTLTEGGKIYARNYLCCDIISSVTVPLPFFLITRIDFPESSAGILKITENVLETVTLPTEAFSDKLGFGLGIAVAIAVSLISRIPAGYTGLKRWRGLWLSDIDG